MIFQLLAGVLLLTAATPALAAPASGSAASAHRPIEEPVLGFNGKMGFAWGGDSLLSAEYVGGSEAEITAGGGYFLSLGARWTPLSFHEALRLGVALDGCFKQDTLYVHSDGTAELQRWPVILSVHALLALGGYWHLTAATGVQYETGIELQGHGVLDGLDVQFDDALGGMAEAGIMFYANPWGADIALRYTLMRYQSEAQGIDASNMALVFGFHIDVL